MKLSIQDVTKTYDGKTVLKHINLETEASAIGIIGASGCGKSTLLRQLSGIETPDEGTITINALSPIVDKRRFQESMDYVFQKHNLFPHLSIRDNILLILEKIRGLEKAEACRIVEDVLAQMQLLDVADRRPNQISGGQAQRASIARALATNPQLIFLDEPTAALDPMLTKEVLHAVKALKQNGRDFIFVTHEIAFLKEFADYVVFMEQGEIVERGSMEHLIDPQTDALERFLNMDEK